MSHLIQTTEQDFCGVGNSVHARGAKTARPGRGTGAGTSRTPNGLQRLLMRIIAPSYAAHHERTLKHAESLMGAVQRMSAINARIVETNKTLRRSNAQLLSHRGMNGGVR